MSKVFSFIFVGLGFFSASILISCEKKPQAPVAPIATPTPAVSPSPTPAATVSATPEPLPALANLVTFKNEVSYRRAQELVWNDIQPELPFYRQDAVHTLGDSQALIRYVSGSEVSMKENTYLIIDEASKKEEGSPKIDRAVMRAGKVEGQTSGEMWILTSSALIKFKAPKKDQKAKIKIQIKEKKSLEVELKAGTGEVLLAQADKGQDVKAPAEARAVDLSPNKNVSIPLKQTTSENFGYKTESTDWLETVKVIKEAIHTAPTPKPTPKATPVVAETPQPTPSVTPSPSPTPQAEGAPALNIESPANKSKVTDETVMLTGTVSPAGSVVKLNGRSCPVDEALHFTCKVPLQVGFNLFVVQMTTPNGKTLFEKWMLTRMPRQ